MSVGSRMFHSADALGLQSVQGPAKTTCNSRGLTASSLGCAAAGRAAQTVFGHLTANAQTAKMLLLDVIPRLPAQPSWPEHFSLDSALVTARQLWPPAVAKKLGPILGRFL